MPTSALFLIMMGAGGFLLYAAVKGEHPWQMFTTTLSGASGPTIQPGAPNQPGQTGYGAALGPVNQKTGAAK